MSAKQRLTSPEYSVVIPVYNSSESLKSIAARVDQVFKDQVAASYELIMIDDASPDPSTWHTLQGLSRDYPEVQCIQLMRNFGKHAAVLCGLERAKGEFIIVMDDDLQHRPEDIPLLIEERAHDLVLGFFSKKHHSFPRRTASVIMGWFESKLVGKPSYIVNSPFKLIRRDLLRAMLNIRTPYPIISSMLFFCTRDIVNVEVTHEARKYGKSGFTLRKMILAFSNLLINNSSYLLQVLSVTGFIVSLVSFLIAFVVIIKKLTVGIEVPGWTSIMLLIAIQGGLVLLSLGVIGEYLIRIVSSADKKPAYIIRSDTEDRS